LIVDDVEIMIQAAVDGLGLAFGLEEHVAPQLATGKLVRVLEDSSAPFPDTFCITEVVGSSQRRSPRSSIRFGCSVAACSVHGHAPTHSPATIFRNSDVNRSFPVNHGV
jgi:DNA-binding transcriptional LysR family regulator